MEGIIGSSELGSPGLYFTGHCRNPECQLNGKNRFFYIGTGKVFDFVIKWHMCICKHCAQTIVSIKAVGFFRCRWQFSGLLEDCTKVTSEYHYSYGFSTCEEPKTRKWLRLDFGVWNFTRAELEESANKIGVILEHSAGKHKRNREWEQRDKREGTEKPDMQSVAIQSEIGSYSGENFDLITLEAKKVENLLSIVKKSVKEKEAKYQNLNFAIERIKEEISNLKQRKRN